MTALAAPVASTDIPRPTIKRRLGAALALAISLLVMVFAFISHAHPGERTQIDLTASGSATFYPNTRLSMYLLSAIVTVCFVALLSPRTTRAWTTRLLAIGIGCFVLALLIFSAGSAGQLLNLPALGATTIQSAAPLILGALTGVMCERSGVINIAIEGQMLVGAFTGTIIGSWLLSTWWGLAAGAISGAAIGAILAVFAIKYRMDQIILGVVLDVFATGFTGFLFQRVLVPYDQTLNSTPTFSQLAIPGLAKIPIIGPILFDQSILIYLMYLIVIGLHVGLFRTRWGLRTRAVGEHPTAADTMGVKVLRVRYRNVIIAGLIAGVAGAYLTVGQTGTFNEGMSSGMGFIALAAMIAGRWSPIGATTIALLFGFSDALQRLLGVLGSPINSNLLLCVPYVVTLFVVAGLVGRVTPPGADGKPYVKS